MSRARSYVSEAIVLRTIPFGETSQVVHLATTEHGLVAALAKGARRPGPELQGGIGLGTLGEASLVRRRGAELELLRRFRVDPRLRGLTASLERYYAACYVIDGLRAWLRPALPNPDLYAAGRTTLRALAGARPASLASWVVFFEARALTAAGHRPRFDGCAACGRPAPHGTHFAPEAGGLVHAACAPGGPRRRVASPERLALERLYTSDLAGLAAAPLTPRDVRAIRAVHDIWVPHVLERRPLSLATVPRA